MIRLEQEQLVREASRAVLEGIDRGENIIVHCVGGTGRTGTVIGCVLRGLGTSADEAIEYLDRINGFRGLGGWRESEWQAEMVGKY